MSSSRLSASLRKIYNNHGEMGKVGKKKLNRCTNVYAYTTQDDTAQKKIKEKIAGKMNVEDMKIREGTRGYLRTNR